MGGAFASRLLGVPVEQAEVLMVAAQDEIGAGVPLRLAFYTLLVALLGPVQPVTAIQLGSGFTSEPVVKSLAVDEALGNIYIGGISGDTGRIAVPAPGGAGMMLVAALFVLCRHRV